VCCEGYSEKESGAKTNRPALARALAALDAGDVLLVTPSRPEHPGPSKLAGHGVQAEGRLAVSRRCVGRQTTPDGRLMLTVLGGLAEFERSLILRRRPRTRDGTGVRFGRKWKLTAHQIAEARKRRGLGEALSDIGRSFNVSHSTISRL
jgi:DNA invertase Pin-like site-specific DNA recombinase